MSAEVMMAPPRRRVFHVQLSASECTEVSYKELVREYERVHGTGHAAAARRIDTSGPDSAGAAPSPEELVGGLPLTTPRTQRYDIIERLEKRYGGGAVVGPPVVGGGFAGPDGDNDDDGFVRGDDDDLYDSEDSFIDDEELQQNIEEIHTQARVQTKHSGFFVNAGDQIETIGGDGSEEDDVENGAYTAGPAKKTKRPKKAGAESSRAVKAFLDEWSEAASDWQPGADIVEAMEGLRRAVRECMRAVAENVWVDFDKFVLMPVTETAPFTKVFPRQLDDALRAVDRLVVDAHPNKWRVNGYFATLMTFLPFTKQYLKSNMLRLEARDAARLVKDEMERSVAALATEISPYAARIELEPIEQVKEDFVKDKNFSISLHRLLQLQDEWLAKENDYRQMLKTEDKKHMKEVDYLQLNARQERNRLFVRVNGLFPSGLMDLQTLRGMSKAAKAKGGPRKTAAAPKAAPISGAPTATVTKSPTSTPKRKLPVVAMSDSTPAKRSIKPFKSRLMDEAPPFVDHDFEEIL